MTLPDLNLLVTLDVLLAEGSVARAAERLRLSPSAMSRALARLRTATGDPLLVRAGRGLVPTPRAIELSSQVRPLVEQATAMLRPVRAIDLKRIERTFTLRTSDGFVENFGPDLVARCAAEAPGVKLRFLQKTDKDGAGLRDGRVDLETGVIDAATSPELSVQRLFRDRLVGVVREGHRLSRGSVTPEAFAAERHILVSRGGAERGQLDAALAALGLEREIAAVVGGFGAALALARASDLVAAVPERHTARLRTGTHAFALPVATAPITVSLIWHPRLSADAAHRWLRGCVRAVCSGDAAQPG